MKFNEKLIELRKKEGLSQEELGYKLNVTRQTVSKWELGQTTPEMDKLIEISKIFNISVDELIKEPEEEINTNLENNQTNPIKDQPIVEKKQKNKRVIFLLVVILILILLYISAKLITSFAIFNQITEPVFGLFNQAQEAISDQLNDDLQEKDTETEKWEIFSETFNNTVDIIEGQMNSIDKPNNNLDPEDTMSEITDALQTLMSESMKK